MSIEQRFSQAGCVPDVVDTAPASKADVTYEGGEQADCGNTLTPTIVQNAPSVTWVADEGALYTLLLTDPDAPSRADPKFGEWRHWLVVNIPGCDISRGTVISEYIGAGPPQGTGLHRYIFLVFKQPGPLNCDEPHQGLSVQGRNNTETRQLVGKYGLGPPVAGNFFQAEWDDYVPKLYAKIK